MNVAYTTSIWHCFLMHARTEEFLYMLLWSCEALTRPTFRNMTQSFESWAYRNGFQRRLARLEQQQLIEARQGVEGNWLHRLTERGTLHAGGGREPLSRWQRSWDGRWRLILFDVPQNRASARERLRRYLRARGFGYLQNSVWVTPDPLTEERRLFAAGPVDVESLLLLEARPCTGESDAEIVAGAWDFAAINKEYATYETVLLQRPREPLNSPARARAFHRWIQEERHAWLKALTGDPLLPQCLLPSGYRGRVAWETRRKLMTEISRRMLGCTVTDSIRPRS
jgi:phenylacetic acid degradation operon negative regulatory protein